MDDSEPAKIKGKLRLQICKGEFLKDHDTFGNMDPYVKVKYLTSEYQTNIHDGGGKEPCWNHCADLFIRDIDQEIMFTVLDKDPIGSDKVGEMKIPVRSLVANDNSDYEAWHEVTLDGEVSGKIQIIGSFEWPQEEE